MKEEPRVIVNEWSGKNETVNAIEDSTVAGNDPSRVFGAEGALQHRLAEIANLCQRTDTDREADSKTRSAGQASAPAHQTSTVAAMVSRNYTLVVLRVST